jgi:hypothetical protein
LGFLALFLLCISAPSQGACATSVMQAAAVSFLELLSIQTHRRNLSDISACLIQMKTINWQITGKFSLDLDLPVTISCDSCATTFEVASQASVAPEAKATRRDGHSCHGNDVHKNDFLDEDSVYGVSMQQQLPQAQGKPVDLPISGFKSRVVYCEASVSSSLIEILSISVQMGETLRHIF